MRPPEPDRLRERYRQLDSEALLALRARGAEMTDEAQRAIAHELASRGVALPPIPDGVTPRAPAPDAIDIACWLLAGLAAAAGVIGFLRTDSAVLPAAALLVVVAIRVVLYRRRQRAAESARSRQHMPG